MARIACPLLVTQGDRDELIPSDRGRGLRRGDRRRARRARRRRALPAGPPPRALQRAAARLRRARLRPPRRSAAPWRRAIGRPRRALYVSSPIGLGHAWRDVAIARELRALHPDLQIDWLAQDPVTRVLEACGERIHPASAALANESRHIAAESRAHELNVFQAWRRMDEILLANFMVFRDVGARRPLRPLDRRRGVGARLLPAREPRAEDHAVRLPHRLRRMAADAGGRRRRGAPDRRLQRRDDRADRALPARARPRDLRRRPRGRRPARLRRRPAGDPPVGAGALRLQRLRPGPGRGRAGRPRGAARRARLPARRDGLPGHRRRLGRRRRAPAPRHRRLPARRRARVPGPAHDRRLRPAHRPRRRSPRTRASSSSPTSIASRATSRPATSPSPRAA